MEVQYTADEFDKDKILVAQLVSHKRYAEAKYHLHDVFLVADEITIQKQISGMLFILDALTQEVR